MSLLVPMSLQTRVASNNTNDEKEPSEVSVEKISEVTLEETDQKLITLNTVMQDIILLLSNELIEEDELPVTTAESNREAVLEEEPELTPEEELNIAFSKWETNFPSYDSQTAQTEFIEKVAPAAVLIADAQGIYPSVMIAQAGLESNWGRSGLARDFNNLMGTKGSTEGESAIVRTREVKNGKSVYINAGFTIYDSWAHSLFHYGTLMKNGLSWDSNYYSGTWIENTSTYRDATGWLQGRYASDPEYAAKLNETIANFNLDQYDDMKSFDSELETALEKLTALNNQ